MSALENEIDEYIEEGILEKYKLKRLTELNCRILLEEIRQRDSLLQKIITERCIIHFYKEEFEKCKIMNEKLQQISSMITQIKFYRVEAENFPDVCSYLHINVLPFLGFFRDGKCVDSIIGFEGIGENDFNTEDLINRIKNSDI